MSIIWVTTFLLFSNCSTDPSAPDPGILQLTKARVGTVDINLTGLNKNIPVDKPIVVEFNAALNPDQIQAHVQFYSTAGTLLPITISFLSNNTTLSLQPSANLTTNTNYTVSIKPTLKGEKGEAFTGFDINFKTTPGAVTITSLKIGGITVSNQRVINVPQDLSIEINFDKAIQPESLSSSIFLSAPGETIPLTTTWSEGNKKLVVTSTTRLKHIMRYRLFLNETIKGEQEESFAGLTQFFYTQLDPTPKFPVVSDDELLTLIQKQTFKYFYDFAQPFSGLARERNTSGDLVTSGGSGFGIMGLIVGMERGFITRDQGITRLDRMLDYLETCDRYHGVWSHWINGNTGKVIPFSTNDNGADLVETSFMVQGLITMRQYLNAADPIEQQLINRINVLWQAVEWDWFTRDGQNVLYWHWSPDKAWAMNMQIKGYNEALIVYVLAASSTTHTISPTVYTNGWASSGSIRNNKLFYNIKLPVGYDFGGPLFFAHYSFMGLNPTNLSDQYANYWEQNVNHTLINRQYCITNPRNFVGYSAANWGLTASDNHFGYSAHSPTNDLGVISPTAALSSMPYTPTESLDAAKYFYYTVGDRMWGSYGFYDAMNITEGWTANSYLAIDQGPILVMIENHRTKLLWNLFMSAPEVQTGLTKLGFTY